MTDEELISVSKSFRDGIIGDGSPEGMCAVVSWPLSSLLLSLYGIENECVESDLSKNDNSQFYEHVWIRLSDGRVLDATFDQFCSEESVPIYLGEPTEFHQRTITI